MNKLENYPIYAIHIRGVSQNYRLKLYGINFANPEYHFIR